MNDEYTKYMCDDKYFALTLNINECVESMQCAMNRYIACVLNHGENDGSLMLHVDDKFVSELYIDLLYEYTNVIEIEKAHVKGGLFTKSLKRELLIN